MARSAHLPIAADRYEACVRTIIFRGMDLRGVALRSQVRLIEDTPGTPLVDLQSTTNGNAEGLRVIDYALDGMVPVTTVEMVINETTMEGLPYSGEMGSATPLAYDLQATIAGRKRKLVHGAFVVLPGVTGADNAPAGRIPGYGGCGQSGGSDWSNATLSFSDDKAQVSLIGLDLLDNVFAAFVAARQDARARMEARGLLYGIANAAAARLFAAEATELAFVDGYYREGYMAHDEVYQVGGWAIEGTPVVIDERGLPVFGDTAPVLYRPTGGDVTFIVEAALPAHDGQSHVIASYVGPAIENRVVVYRNGDGIYALQVYTNEEGLQVVPGPTDLRARTMRVAVTIGRGAVSASFDGRPPIIITATRPALLRLWLGTLAQGYGDVLGGFFRRVAFIPYRVQGTLLQQMSGAPVTDDEVTDLIDQKIRTHDHDRRAHDLTSLRQQADLADSKTGLWSIRAADTFSGADGPLGNTEVGNLPWQQNGLVRKNGRIQQAGNSSASAWLLTGVSDGQVEANLYPGGNEASLYVRLNASLTQWLLLQRAADGSVTLNIQSGGTVRLSAPIALPVVAGERYKIRFIGPRVWVLRVLAGVETLLFDVIEPRLMNETIHGIRLNGGGSADNFRVLSREAI